MHEHVFVLSAEIQENYPETWDEDARVDDAIAKLRAMKAAGVETIVDPTVLGLGRSIPRVQRVNASVDINIVVATGLYTYNDLPHFFDFRGPGTPYGGDEPMVTMFVRDIRDGIAGPGVKAAFLKCAIDRPGMTRGVERAMRAVAAAHRETGVPITVHTSVHNRSGVLAQKLLRDEGVDLGTVVIGHSGDSADLAYLTELIEAGSYLGMDRFGIDALQTFDRRVETVAELCRRGFAERMVLSHDASCHIDWLPPEALRAAPNWHFTHIHDDVLPALRERGVTESDIRTMLVDNPKRYFTKRG
ncbi:MAG: phosphotriesterase-related protein [Candidatus Eremiobacteraeota bacterium]|nr:phosphotriesterase-related protein [Candidatus Eremiobacteraeota bacterium]